MVSTLLRGRLRFSSIWFSVRQSPGPAPQYGAASFHSRHPALLRTRLRIIPVIIHSAHISSAVSTVSAIASSPARRPVSAALSGSRCAINHSGCYRQTVLTGVWPDLRAVGFFVSIHQLHQVLRIHRHRFFSIGVNLVPATATPGCWSSSPLVHSLRSRRSAWNDHPALSPPPLPPLQHY